MQELQKKINSIKNLIEAFGFMEKEIILRNLGRLQIDLQEIKDNFEKKKDAYQDKNGIWRWKSNNRIPFEDMLGCWGLDDEIFNKCLEAREKETTESLNEYRKAMENYVPDAEELYEMKAAFGEGTTVVNVITGKKTQL